MSDQTGQPNGADRADGGRYADAAHRYRLDSIIATGGMGVVWRGTDTRLDRTVAVKVLKDEYADDATFRTRFESEARSAAALHHPGIAGMYDYGASDRPEDHRPPYLVMELVEGQPLSTLLASAKSAGRVLDTAIVQSLMAQAAEALGVAHQAGIIHRDVKPANLLVTGDRQIKITDFGIARAADAVALTRTGSVMGTPQYLSPEQARGNPSTPASDVYSLGVVAFECLAGRRPFEAETPVATALAHLQQPVPALPDSVPADLAAVVTRALAKDPRERYADGAAFAAALRSPSGAGAAPETGTQVLPAAVVAPPMERLDQPSAYAGDEEDDEAKKSPWPIIIAVLLLTTAAVVVAALLLSGGDDERDPDADLSSAPTITDTPPTTPPTTPTEPTTTAPATVEVDARDYVCRQDYADVVNELRDRKLRVTIGGMDENDGSCDENTVSRIEPSGTLEVGDEVTVYYWGPAPEEETTEPVQPTTPTTPTTPPAGDLTGGLGQSEEGDE